MKTISERHQYILQNLKKVGYAKVVDLARELGVSVVTIRKDLRILESKNLPQWLVGQNSARLT